VLLANDTSMGTGFYPLSPLEMLAADLADDLSGDDGFRHDHPWCGTDVKLMLVGDESRFDVVAAVPQVSTYVHSREAYARNKAAVIERCQQMVETRLGDGASDRCSFRVNARDIETKDELYLTLSGSSLESGDEGVVGRGNRANGLITPLRPMNIEGVNGKNPVYHVGKLYNVAALRIAQLLHERHSGHHEVMIVSATGQELGYPWRIHVRSSVPITIEDAANAALSVTLQSEVLTKEILAGQHALA
jgi:S-adenosylmethionine synthetase